MVGIDEVGRGAWAGPLTVGAIVIPKNKRIVGVRDSKQLAERRREQLFDRITGWSEHWGVGHVSPAECDSLGMSEAQRLATRRALGALGVAPDVALVDGKWDFVSSSGVPETKMIVRGDSHSVSIAAASILAKVSRDRIMRSEAEFHPSYDFEFNKGYPCPRHQRALQGYGPTAIHRRSWAFMDSLCWTGSIRKSSGM